MKVFEAVVVAIMTAVIMLLSRAGAVWLVWTYWGLGSRLLSTGPITFAQAGYWNIVSVVMIVQIMTADEDSK